MDQHATSVSVNVRELLTFFDEVPVESKPHATAIVSICGEDLGRGLLRHHFESCGFQVQAEPRCTTGGKKGPRLDCWLKATKQDCEQLFQVEIKSWSAHAIGGKKLRLDASPEELELHKRERWHRIWDEERGIIHSGLIKVLTPMKLPEGWLHMGLRSEPMVCLWDAMHPTGGPEALFSRDIPYPHWCPRVWFFSMSAYLRNHLADECVWLKMSEMSNTVARMEWLKKIIKQV